MIDYESIHPRAKACREKMSDEGIGLMISVAERDERTFRVRPDCLQLNPDYSPKYRLHTWNECWSGFNVEDNRSRREVIFISFIFE
jgi:hypothetical protein